MAIVAFITSYAASTIATTLPFAREALGISEGGMSTVFAITRAVSLLGLAFSVAADRVGRRKPFLIAFLLLPVGNIVTAFAPGRVLFIISQSFSRMAVIGVAALAIVILAEELTPAVRGYGIALYAMAGSAGAGFGLILLPIAERTDDSYRILFGLAGFGLLAYPLLSRFLMESRAFVPRERMVPFRRVFSAGLGKHFWPLALMGFFIAAFSAPAFDFVFERLIDDLGWETGPARFLILVFSGLGTVGLLIGGRLADIQGRKPTTATALVLGLVGGIGFYTLDSGWLMAPSIFLATLGATMLTPAFAAHRSELFPTSVRARAGAWITNVAILGSILGFTVGGVAIDRIGLSATISLLGIGLVISMFLVFMLPETRGVELIGRTKGRSDATRRATAPGSPSAQPSPTRHREGPSQEASPPPGSQQHP